MSSKERKKVFLGTAVFTILLISFFEIATRFPTSQQLNEAHAAASPKVEMVVGHVRSAQIYHEPGQSEKTIIAFEGDDGKNFTLCFDRIEPWLYPGLHTSIEFEKTGKPCGTEKRTPAVSFDQQLWLLNSRHLDAPAQTTSSQ